MITKITDDLIQEATKLLENWAKKNNLLPKGKKLLVTMSIEDVESVSLQMEDKTSSAKLDEILAQPIKKLKLDTRSSGCLKNGCYYIIGDLVRKTESDFLRLRNFGRKSLRDVKSRLKDLGLSVEMDIPVGPREREAVLRCSCDYYVYYKVFPILRDAGIVSVEDLLSMTEDEVIAILKDCDPEKIGSSASVYHDMRQSFRQRGLI